MFSCSLSDGTLSSKPQLVLHPGLAGANGVTSFQRRVQRGVPRNNCVVEVQCLLMTARDSVVFRLLSRTHHLALPCKPFFFTFYDEQRWHCLFRNGVRWTSTRRQQLVCFRVFLVCIVSLFHLFFNFFSEPTDIEGTVFQRLRVFVCVHDDQYIILSFPKRSL